LSGYLDSSGAVKLFLGDEGSTDELRAFMEFAGTIATSRLTYVETRAALAAARRAGRIGSVEHDEAVSRLEAAWRTFTIVDLTQAIAEDAGTVAEAFGLRAGDAVQFASLRGLETPNVPLIAWDERLRAAAQASGFPCYPVEV